ncbi:MAG TPA: hypothetical protein VD902_02800 [Symbiobacteriaceae bacterium]|nr:hypothetical protein [Symbiobacteriaceae bacterium]
MNNTEAPEAEIWQNTLLWNRIHGMSGPLASNMQVMLKTVMPNIQTVLDKGGTSPTNFTLHDAGHAFRVAQRMAEIMPKDTMEGLSVLELGLLLLSAYLHDIGMVPEERNVIGLHTYLLTGDCTRVSPEESAELQEWLDDHDWEVQLPITGRGPIPEELSAIRELLTHFCRYRHNEWSGKWIRASLQEWKGHLYPNWLEDLVTLCQSHHEGYAELVSDRFHPRIVNGLVLHLRYLAVVLRVADILEFDPERTPPVLLRHRDIPDSSVIYWHKDQFISRIIENSRLVISARPTTARIHKAIQTMIEEIDVELRLAAALGAETHYDKCPGLDATLAHRWDLAPSVHRDVKPAAGTYDYIEGAFRPNTKKLLQLLSGKELYGNELAAVREMLQNACDAIREQIAWERLKQSDPGDDELAQILGRIHHIRLKLEVKEGDAYLTCTDSGVGMNKRLIQDYLLVSGSSRRHEVVALERKCNQAGFALERTGQFGIGVLSYFMLARKVIIRTRRSQDASEPEANGWRFETEGIGSFGELTMDSIARGTEVTLELRRSEIDWRKWWNELRDYVEETVSYVPCRLELSTNIPQTEPLQVGPGWARPLGFWVNRQISRLEFMAPSHLRRDMSGFMSHSRRTQIEKERAEWGLVSEELRGAIKWEVHTGFLTGLGRYRVLVPYFALPGGSSLAFLRVNPSKPGVVRRTGEGWMLRPGADAWLSYKGMRVDEPREDFWWSEEEYSPCQGAYVEVDWFNPKAGKLSVSRSVIELTPAAQTALAQLDEKLTQIVSEMCTRFSGTPYDLLNCCVAGFGLPRQANWLNVPEDDEGDIAELEPLNPPMVSSFRRGMKLTRWSWNGQPVMLLNEIIERSGSENLTWHPLRLAPNRLVFLEDFRVGAALVPLFDTLPLRADTFGPGVRTQFPPSLRTVCMARLGSSPDTVFLNVSHPLIQAIEDASWKWVGEVFEKSIDPTPHFEALAQYKSRGAAWVLNA